MGYAPTVLVHKASRAPSKTFDEIGFALAWRSNVVAVMSARNCLRTSSLLLAAVACLAACHPDKGPGSISVSYVLGNHKTCDELGVERIEVTVYQGTLEDPSVEYSDMLICNDAGEAFIGEIEPGIYAVSAVGYDADDVATYDNEGQPAADRRVEIFEAAEAQLEAKLTGRPAQLRVGWRLGADGFGNCTGVGIDRFEIIAYEVGGGTALLEATLDCELIGDDEGYRLVPDPERLLNGSRFGEVGIQPLDSDGMNVGTAETFMFTPPGPGYGVDLRIECDNTGCVMTN